jgi:glycosyltransferase involved in cell wall biosynthesis
MAMSDAPLRIGFAGTLGAYWPGSTRQRPLQWLLDWVWTYRVKDIDHHTRSGYYLLRGVQRFAERYPELRSQLEVTLWGLVDQGNARQAAQMGVGDLVRVEGYYPKAESAARIQACDLLFLPLETGPDPLFIPGKTFDYLKQGKPVLILGHQSDCTDILVRAGIGILLDPFDPDHIADHLATLVRERASLPQRYQVDRDYVRSHFHFEALTAQLDAVFMELLES